MMLLVYGFNLLRYLAENFDRAEVFGSLGLNGSMVRIELSMMKTKQTGPFKEARIQGVSIC